MSSDAQSVRKELLLLIESASDENVLVYADRVLGVIGSKEHGFFRLPVAHRFGMEVPEGGSSCSKCAWFDGGCANRYYQEWRKSLGKVEPSRIPAAPERYCCDVYDTTRKTK